MNATHVSRLQQIKIYTGKCIRIFRNEKGYKLIVSAAVISVLIAWVTGGDMFSTFSGTHSGAFAIVCACIWIGIFNSIQSVCRERDILKREYRTGLSLTAYVLAHMLFEALLCLVETVVVGLIFLLLSGGPSAPGLMMAPVLELLLAFFLTMYAADLLAMAVSCAVRTENAAMTAMPFVLIIQLVLSDVVFSLDGFARLLSNLTIAKWGVEAVCTIANANNLYGSLFGGGGAQYEYTVANLVSKFRPLVLFCVLYGIVCRLLLVRINSDKR